MARLSQLIATLVAFPLIGVVADAVLAKVRGKFEKRLQLEGHKTSTALLYALLEISVWIGILGAVAGAILLIALLSR